jgi:hypothetical protein
MTAPAAATASGPIATTVVRVPHQPPADRLAFAAVLDSLPGGAAKAGASIGEEQPHPSSEPRQKASPPGQPSGHSPLRDNALLASLPFALQAASMTDNRPQAADNALSRATAATKGPGPEQSGGSIAASAKAPTVGRLIGERAFHFGVSTPPSVIASRSTAIGAPFAPAAATAVGANLAPKADLGGETALAAGFATAEPMPARPFGYAVPSSDNAAAPAPIAPRAGAPATNRASSTRAAAHDASRSGRKLEVSAPAPVAQVASSAAAAAPVESSGKAADGRPPDPIAAATPSATQAGAFGAQLSAPFAAGPSFEPDGSTARAADTAPRASALAADPAPSTPPVREIDVDLSPGGLENVSMTMRLAGEKLSVVIRAASSQTLGSIEGARDAIADRLAAIGQPLDSLIVKQAGVNADGNSNGNAASADDGSTGEKWRSAQDAGERGGSNDASLSRRGAARDRSF